MKYSVLVVLFALVVLALTAACTTTRAPGVCCVGAEDCSRLGLTEDWPCDPGQACVDFHCTVASCSTQGCAAGTPVCDDGVCRGCRVDAECPSGACADDGSCVAEARVVYLSPMGADAGSCARGAPCRGLTFAAGQTSTSRNHIVIAPGAYDYGVNTHSLTAATTTAPRIFIHGGGASMSTTSDSSFLEIAINATIRDLEFIGTGTALRLSGTDPVVLERIRIRSGHLLGINVFTQVTMRDVRIEDAVTGIRISNSARLTIDRSVISGGDRALQSSTFGTTVELRNLLVFGTSDVAIDLALSSGGTIESTTIADVGADGGSGPRAFKCPPFDLIVRSSIIWAPGITARPPIDDTCTLVYTIAGPVPVPGAANTDPRFVDPVMRDYHLSANSPARDAIDAGPSFDFEGDPRPRGSRFDIGADESP